MYVCYCKVIIIKLDNFCIALFSGVHTPCALQHFPKKIKFSEDVFLFFKLKLTCSKRPVLQPCAVDGHSRNPLHYYYDQGAYHLGSAGDSQTVVQCYSLGYTLTALYNISNIFEVRIFNIFKLKVTKCLVR